MSEFIFKKVVILGGGPAGLAAACALYEHGIKDILILEREPRLGGILNQCIHDGFGLTRFQEALSGPEYAGRFIDKVHAYGIAYQTGCTVVSLTSDKKITAASCDGLIRLQAEVVILAMGCRERPRGAMSIPGDRPSGVFTAGVAQNYINVRNCMVGKDAIILGSGDIGMIMARRLTLEGVKVHAVFEILPYPSGLPRNIEQCLNDYDIPLFLRHTVTRINGRSRLESVTVSEVGPDMQPIPGTERIWPCDTLILSVGLIPENELSRMAGVELDPRTRGPKVDETGQTSIPGIFAAGNVLQVHDLVDFVSLEAEGLAGSVEHYLQSALAGQTAWYADILTDDSITYTVPQRLAAPVDFSLSFRPRRPMQNIVFEAHQGDTVIGRLKVKKALPAVMLHMKVKGERLKPGETIKVVCIHE